jgi:hypothetical protein
MTARILLALVVSFVAVTAGTAQDFTRMDINGMNNAFNARLNAAATTTTNSIVSSNLRNPQVQAMYRQHVAQGGQYSAEQFAYMYAATGGFTPQGTAYFQATENRNRAAEMNAYNGLREAQANRANAQANLWAGYHRNNAEFGNQLMGNSTYTNNYTGQQHVLSHTQQAGQIARDYYGNYYTSDAYGNKYMYNNGWWQPMNGR